MSQFSGTSRQSSKRTAEFENIPAMKALAEAKRQVRVYINPLVVCGKRYLPYEDIYYQSYLGT